MVYYIYITTNPGRTTLYIGMTNNLGKRLQQHQKNKGKPETFAGRYYCYNLIYYEAYKTPMEATEKRKGAKEVESKKERSIDR